MVTYVKDENLSQEQETKARLPWRKDVEIGSMFGSYAPTSLVAQGDGRVKSITCRILHDGHVLVENTSSGAYAVVTCAGS